MDMLHFYSVRFYMLKLSCPNSLNAPVKVIQQISGYTSIAALQPQRLSLEVSSLAYWPRWAFCQWDLGQPVWATAFSFCSSFIGNTFGVSSVLPSWSSLTSYASPKIKRSWNSNPSMVWLHFWIAQMNLSSFGQRLTLAGFGALTRDLDWDQQTCIQISDVFPYTSSISI